MLHIALEVVENPDLEKFSKVVSDILKPYKKFKVEMGSIYFDQLYKSINLKVENKGYIIRLTRQINEILKLHRFNVKENLCNIDLKILLANTNYQMKEWNTKEHNTKEHNHNIVFENIKIEGAHKMARIDRMALWKPVNSKKEIVVKYFPLRDF